ncbi:hypothetical protein [Actinoplanes sp. NBRC 101535]|nr:hypothetical protein [Actinoplanes sp. NBRC 101535]GLX99781.1 hypothetical protein Acsp01_01610 [Actinoplanes sp. NBRC 101535]
MIARWTRAEVIKLSTLPSLRLTALLTVAATLLLTTADVPGPVLVHTQAGFLVLGALAGAHEHQGGRQIDATLLAMPRRTVLPAARSAALAVVTVPVALLAATGDGRPGAWLYLTATTLTAAGVGALLRNPVAAVGALLTAYHIGFPILIARLPAAGAWSPGTALLEPGRGAAAMIAGTVLALLAATVSLARRDA